MLSLDFLSNEYEDKKTPAEKVRESIEIDILTGAMRPGQKIVEQNFCEKYHMSRTPIREILHRVEADGLIEIIPNRGAFVLGLSERDIEDFFYMKSILEIQCVKWAIERITDNEMKMLEETFEFMEFYTMSEDLNKIIRINRGFDAIIYNAAKNKEIESNLLRYNFYIRYANADIKYPINYLPTVLEEHRAIFNAFREKNPEAGKEATEIHMYKSMMRRK